MNGVEYTRGHASPKDFNHNLYKIIFTKAVIRNGAEAEGRGILKSVYLREPIVEVWVDLSAHAVVKVLDLPENIKYRGVPVAVY